MCACLFNALNARISVLFSAFRFSYVCCYICCHTAGVCFAALGHWGQIWRKVSAKIQQQQWHIPIYTDVGNGVGSFCFRNSAVTRTCRSPTSQIPAVSNRKLYPFCAHKFCAKTNQVVCTSQKHKKKHLHHTRKGRTFINFLKKWWVKACRLLWYVEFISKSLDYNIFYLYFPHPWSIFSPSIK